MNEKFNIVVCSSGSGGNFKALIDDQKKIGYEITLLIIDRDCLAKNVAIKNNIKYKLIDNKSSAFFDEMDKAIPYDTDLIVLAGFFPIINSYLVSKWRGRMINTHPSLLPKYGGIGMYGVNVQEAVMAAREKYAGCTVHYVNSTVDGGEIILQKAIKINYNESPWELGGRIFVEENKLLVKAVKFLKNKLGRRG
jgi:phosphoribosylglycinamide formyltransferase-1